MLAERCVGERLQRVVQHGELADDRSKVLACIEATVQACQLSVQAVEALEERVELAIADFVLLHAPDCRRKRRNVRTA